MNEKLFKKLNEEIELIEIKKSAVVNEFSEMNFIFNGLPLIEDYWLAKDIIKARNKYPHYLGVNPKKEKESLTPKEKKELAREKIMKEQEKYDSEVEDLNNDDDLEGIIEEFDETDDDEPSEKARLKREFLEKYDELTEELHSLNKEYRGVTHRIFHLSNKYQRAYKRIKDYKVLELS